MRYFPYWTVGKIIETIKEDGFTTFNRMSFRNLERRGNIPEIHRTAGKWRTLSEKQAIEIMRIIWSNTFGEEAGAAYYAKLKTRYLNSGNQ
jgi:hypothetical protein